MAKAVKKLNNRRTRAELVKVPRGILSDMNQILLYNWHEELRNYEEMKMERGCGRHVFTYMRRVRDWLDSQRISNR
jgi:hypothetical protein